MSIATLLTPEFQEEMKKTREALVAVPEGRGDFKAHPKSMACDSLVGHLAQMPGFLTLILTTDELDLAKGDIPPLKFESQEQILAAFDGLATEAGVALGGTTDAQMEANWVLVYGEHLIFSGTRYQALRTMGMNHMIHHRAQVGVYLRLMDCPVPSTYGPSADSAS